MTDVSGLSGRCDAIEANVTNLIQQILTKIDIETLQGYQQTVNQTVTLAQSSLDSMSNKINVLQSLYSSLVLTTNTRYGYFTGITGQLAIQNIAMTGIKETTGNLTLTPTGIHKVIGFSGANMLWTLPNLSGILGHTFSFKKAFTGLNTITISGWNSSQLIDNASVKTLTGSYESRELLSSLTGWYELF
jgi:hypothetical protein